MSKFLASEEDFKWLEQLGIGETVQGLYDGKGFININHIDRKTCYCNSLFKFIKLKLHTLPEFNFFRMKPVYKTLEKR